jgi:flavodoxin
MNIYIMYATNSGSTYTAAKVIKESLEEAGHHVSLNNARECQLSDCLNADFVIWGSPSWKWEDDEGAPHEAFIERMQQEASIDFASKRFAVYGCGDSDYTYFCGAVDKLSTFIREHHGEIVTEPLRLDGFFFNLDASVESAQNWATELSSKLQSSFQSCQKILPTRHSESD